jgi:hypothetical protein
MIKEYKLGDVVTTKYGVEFSIANGPFDAHGQHAYETFQLHTLFESDIKKKVGVLLMNGQILYKENIDGSDTKRNSKKRSKKRN